MARRVRRDQPDHREKPDLQVRRDHKVRLARKDQPEPQVRRDHKVQLVLKDQQALPAHKVLRVSRVPPALRDRREPG